MSALKCPNPSCPFLFDPSQVPPGALLTCPRCGMRFTLGPQAGYAPPSYPQQPLGYPPPEFPAQPPSEPTATFNPSAAASPVPEEAPPTNPAHATATRADKPGTQAHRDPRNPEPKRGRGPGVAFAAVGGVLLILVVIVFAIVLSGIIKRDPAQGDGTARGDLTKPEFNFAYKMPGDPWSNDSDTKNDLNVNAFCIKREGPTAWAALSVSDFKERSPLLHELREKMLDQLRRAFQNLPEDLTLEPVKWAGKDGYFCRFRGERRGTETTCLGDCYVLSYKGIGYWFYTWSAESEFDSASTELNEMRNRFRTMNEREKWTEKVGNKVVFPRKGNHRIRYQIATYEKFWKEFPEDPVDARPKADLALRGEFTSRQKKDLPPFADLIVTIVDSGDDAMDAGAKEVRAHYNREPDVYGKFTLTELSEDPQGEPPLAEEEPNVTPRRYKVSPADPNASKSAEKLVIYTAIKVDDKVVIAEASCPWSQRSIWERRLMQFVGSLKAK